MTSEEKSSLSAMRKAGRSYTEITAQLESCQAVPSLCDCRIYSLLTIQVPAIMMTRATKNSGPGISRNIMKDSATPMKGATA